MKRIVILTLVLLTNLQLLAQVKEEGVAAPPVPPITYVEPKPQALPEIVEFPDVDSEFPGGNHLLKAWIEENLYYPEISIELEDQGRVIVRFVVEMDGSVSNVKVIDGGVTPELNREAKRIVRSMPKWTPGEMKGKPVRTRCQVPVTFTLD